MSQRWRILLPLALAYTARLVCAVEFFDGANKYGSCVCYDWRTNAAALGGEVRNCIHPLGRLAAVKTFTALGIGDEFACGQEPTASYSQLCCDACGSHLCNLVLAKDSQSFADPIVMPSEWAKWSAEHPADMSHNYNPSYQPPKVALPQNPATTRQRTPNSQSVQQVQQQTLPAVNLPQTTSSPPQATQAPLILASDGLTTVTEIQIASASSEPHMQQEIPVEASDATVRLAANQDPATVGSGGVSVASTGRQDSDVAKVNAGDSSGSGSANKASPSYNVVSGDLEISSSQPGAVPVLVWHGSMAVPMCVVSLGLWILYGLA